MTETSPLTTINPSKRVRKLGSIGLPLLNTGISLVDPATGRKAAVGESGEICINEKTLKADILRMARERLPPYEVPKYIEIREELPLTVVGKIDKKVLRKEVK
jgi:acyl-CoA synthetase (AMP-forming)/AMP-acid ligase II